MKICKKCKREYKDDYIYCPQCGKPYDDSIKPVKTPGDIGGTANSTLSKIWNIILYIFGGFMIFGSILTILDDPVNSIIGILFGLSLFQFIYTIIEDKMLIGEKSLKVTRIALPIILLFLMGVTAPADNTSVKKKEQNQQIQENNSNDVNKNENTETKETENNNINNNGKNEKKGDSSLSLYGTSGSKMFKKICKKVGITPSPSSTQKGNYIIYAEANMNYNINIDSTLDKDEIMSLSLTHYYDNGSINNDFFLVLTELDYDGANKEELANWINKNIGTNSSTKIGSLNFELKKSDENYVTLNARTDRAQ